MGAEALRAKMRRELNAAGREVARVSMALALGVYQACQRPEAWGPEPSITPDPEHPERPTTKYTAFGLMETFWKMQIPVLSVQYRLRFFAWDRAISAANTSTSKQENQENQEVGDDGHR